MRRFVAILVANASMALLLTGQTTINGGRVLLGKWDAGARRQRNQPSRVRSCRGPAWWESSTSRPMRAGARICVSVGRRTPGRRPAGLGEVAQQDRRGQPAPRNRPEQPGQPESPARRVPQEPPDRRSRPAARVPSAIRLGRSSTIRAAVAQVNPRLPPLKPRSDSPRPTWDTSIPSRLLGLKPAKRTMAQRTCCAGSLHSKGVLPAQRSFGTPPQAPPAITCTA